MIGPERRLADLDGAAGRSLPAREPAARVLKPTQVVIDGGDARVPRSTTRAGDRERPQIESLGLEKPALMLVDHRQIVEQGCGLEMTSAEPCGGDRQRLTKARLGLVIVCVDAVERPQAA